MGGEISEGIRDRVFADKLNNAILTAPIGYWPDITGTTRLTNVAVAQTSEAKRLKSLSPGQFDQEVRDYVKDRAIRFGLITD